MPKTYYAGTVLAKLGIDASGFVAGYDKVGEKNKELEAAIAKQQKKVKALGVAFTVVGGAILAGFTKASQGAREFNKQIANITTLTTPAITNTNELKESIRRLSIDAGKHTEDVAGGAYEVASAFGEAALQGKSLEINVKGATAGMASVTEAIKLTSAVTKGFGDTSDEAQQKVIDLSFITVKLGQTTFPELAASIGKTVPLMAAMGGKQEELFAGFATLTGVTGTAAEVSTQFSGVLGAMIKPSTAMIKAINIAGKQHLGLADATGKDLVEQLGLVGAMKAIIATTDGSITAMGKLIRRKEALTAVLALTGGQADVFTEKLEAMSVSEDAAEEAFRKVTQGVNAQGFAMEQATIKMEVATQRLGEAVTPALAAFKTILADIALGIAEWMKENPGLTKVIVTFTAAIAGLMIVIGPLLIALPFLAAGFVKLKIALVAIPALMGRVTASLIAMKTVILGMGPLLWSLGAAGVGAFIGWKIGRVIADVLKLNTEMSLIPKIAGDVEIAIIKLGKSLGENSKFTSDHAIAIAKNRDAFDQLSFKAKLAVIQLIRAREELKKIEESSRAAMGFTAAANQAQFLREELTKLAQEIDPNVTKLRDVTRTLKDNKEAYEALHPRLRRIVDGMTAFRITTIETNKVISEESKKPVAQTIANVAAVLEIQNAADLKIRELTLSQTAFKINQLNEEHQKTLDILIENNATKIQMQSFERAHTLELQKIRDEAHKVKLETEKKQRVEEQKALDIIIEEREAEIKREEARQSAHQGFLQGLRKQQQDLMLQEIAERDGWRVGELARVDVWESEQLVLAQMRFENEKLSFQEFQDEKIAINQLGSDKREQIENEAREEQERLDDERIQRYINKLAKSINAATRIYRQYLNQLSDFFTASTTIRENELNAWYDEELRRINESTLSNEDKTLAIEQLDAGMHQKKAALEAQSQKREKFIAKGQAIANTAVAITMALKSAPWPWNLPAIAFAIFTGAAQIKAVGGAYSAPGMDSFAPGGGGETVGVGGGGRAGGGGGGREVTAFQTGTQGFITPPSDFLVGEPLSTERVQIRGDRSQVSMAVTPMGNQQPVSQGGITFNITIPVTAIDTANFKTKIQNEIIPALQEALFAGLLMIPRKQVR